MFLVLFNFIIQQFIILKILKERGMRMRNIKNLSFILLLILSSSCSFLGKEHLSSINDEFYLYVNNGGNLEIINIREKNKQINVDKNAKVNFKETGDILHSLAYIKEGKIIGTFYDKVGGNLNNKVVTIYKDKVKKDITLKNKGPSHIIADPIRNRAYILSAILPGVHKNGIPLEIINTSSDREIGSISIKGAPLNYSIYKDKLYLTVVKANELGYQDVPNNYILQIDLPSGIQRIMTPNGFNYSPKGMSISNDGNIFVIKMPLNPKEFKNSSLIGYDLYGNQICEYPLPTGGRDIVIDEDGLAYITHNDKEIYGDRKGTTITVIDTNTGEDKGKIDGLYSPTEVEMYDEFLFVINDFSNTISVVNKAKKKIIENISFGNNAVLSSMLIVPGV